MSHERLFRLLSGPDRFSEPHGPKRRRAREGLDLWREHRPDIVVLDQRMPGITGLDVAEQILSEEPDQPIILFSAYLDDDLRQASSRLGIRACLDKRDVRRLPDVIWDIVQAS